MNNKLIFGLVLSLLLCSVSAFALDSADVVAAYEFENDLTDSEGTLDLSAVGTIGYTTGKDGNALNLGGATNYASASTNPISGNTYASFSYWVKFDTLASKNGLVLIKGASNKDEFGAYIYNTDEVIVVARNDDNTHYGFVDTAFTPTTGTWYHIVQTWDGTQANADKMRIWVNDVEYSISWNSNPDHTTVTPVNNFAVGAHTGQSAYTDGQFDDVVVWDVALTDQDVEDLYNSGAGVYYPYASDPIPSQPFFEVTAKDIDTTATLYNITVTLENGTIYTNVTNSIVVTPFNDSSLQNFTVSVDNYFNQTFINHNTSFDLQVNLTQYPYVGLYDVWSNESLSGTLYVNVSGITTNGIPFAYDASHTITDGLAYVPYNNTQNLLFRADNTYYNQIVTGWDFANSNDINKSTFQAALKLSANEIITENSVSPANYTINGITKTDEETWYIKTGTYNVTFSSPIHYSKTVEINIVKPSVCSGTCLYNNTEIIPAVSGTVINVTASNLLTGAPIDTFDVVISNTYYGYSEEYTTTNGWVALSSIQETPFNITIDAAEYAILNTTITPNVTLYNHTFRLYTTNSINITFKDTETNAIINDRNITVDFIGSVQTYNQTTNDGNLYVDLITPDAYIVRYSSEGYAESFYHFTMVNRTTQAVTLYLTNSTSTTDVTINIFDETNNDIESALVKVLRFDVDTGTYVQVEAKLTNFEGKTTIPVTLNSEFYKFIIEYPAGTIVKTTQPSYITGTTLNIQVRLSDDVAANFYKLTGVSYLLTFDDELDKFTFTYSDSSNTASKGCLNIYRVSVKDNVLVNSTCSSSATSSITLGVNNATGATYKADAFIYFGNEKNFLGSLFKSYTSEDLFGTIGLFALIIVTVFIVFVARWSLTATVLLLPLPMVGLRVLQIIPIGWDYIAGIVGLSFIIAFLLGGKGK